MRKRKSSMWRNKSYRRWAMLAEDIAAGDPVAVAKYRRLTERQYKLLDQAIHEGWRMPFRKIEFRDRLYWKYGNFRGEWCLQRTRIYFDGELVYTTPVQHYATGGALAWLVKRGFVPKNRKFWEWFRHVGVEYSRPASVYVKRERDL